MKGFTLSEDQAMCLALLAEAEVAGTLGEALGPETVAAGSQALGFTLRLDLRRELVPRQWRVSGLGPQASAPAPAGSSRTRGLLYEPHLGPGHRDQVFLSPGPPPA